MPRTRWQTLARVPVMVVGAALAGCASLDHVERVWIQLDYVFADEASYGGVDDLVDVELGAMISCGLEARAVGYQVSLDAERLDRQEPRHGRRCWYGATFDAAAFFTEEEVSTVEVLDGRGRAVTLGLPGLRSVRTLRFVDAEDGGPLRLGRRGRAVVEPDVGLVEPVDPSYKLDEIGMWQDEGWEFTVPDSFAPGWYLPTRPRYVEVDVEVHGELPALTEAPWLQTRVLPLPCQVVAPE